MPAPLSVIIPTLNSERDLPSCLEGLLPGLEAGLIREVIVSDGGSQDSTAAIAGSAGAAVIEAGAGREKCLRAGAEAARGEWFLFLDAGTTLSREWAERAGAHMAERPGAAATFRLKYKSDARAARRAEASANRRTDWLGLADFSQGLMIARALYKELGGIPDIPDYEIVRFQRVIGKRRLMLLDAEARASAVLFEQEGWRVKARHDGARLVRFLMG